MKKFIHRAAMASVFSIIGVQAVRAGTFQSGGGAWDDGTTGTPATDWSTISGGLYNTAWTPSGDAVFEGTAGTLTIAAAGPTAHSLTFNTSGYIVTSGTLTLNGSAVAVNSGTATINSAISTSGGLVLSGGGTLSLGGANTNLTGGITVSAGTLQLTGGSPSTSGGASSGTITLNDANTGSNNATLTLNQTANGTSAQIANNITVANQGSGTTTINLGAANTITTTGVITLNKTTTIAANNTGGVYLGASFTGGATVITGNVGTLTLKETGAGAIFIGHRADNTYVGTTVIAQGTVGVYHNAAFGSVTNPLTMQGTSTLLIDNNSSGTLSIGDLTGVSGNTISTSALAGGSTRSLTVTTAGNTTFAGVITQAASAQAVSVTKAGSGTQTLSGVNTYLGSTTVSNGILKMGVAGALPTSSSVVLSGGAFNTNSFSQTTSGTLSITGTASIDFGAGNTNTALHFADSHLVSWTGGALTVADWTGSLSGGGNDQFYVGNSGSGLSAAQLAQINFTGYSGAQQLSTGEVVPVSVPEPTVFGIIALAAGGLLGRRRRIL